MILSTPQYIPRRECHFKCSHQTYLTPMRSQNGHVYTTIHTKKGVPFQVFSSNLSDNDASPKWSCSRNNTYEEGSVTSSVLITLPKRSFLKKATSAEGSAASSALIKCHIQNPKWSFLQKTKIVESKFSRENTVPVEIY
jgi:hypothetical protein